MTKKILQNSIAFGIFILTCSVAHAGVREDVSELMEGVRTQEVFDDSALRTAPPSELLIELRKYLSDPVPSVRMVAVSQAVGIAQRNSSEREIRQQVVDFILTVAQSDVEPSIAGYAAAMTYTFPPYFVRDDFTNEMWQDIFELLKSENLRTEFILLAGVADAQIAKERLQEIAESIDNSGRRAAHFALARMGDKDSIEHVIKEFESYNVTNTQNKIIKSTRLLQDLAYTRQPDAIKIIIRYLNSEQRLPSERERTLGAKAAEYALDLLAQIIEDFPIESEGPSYTEAEIKQARAWVKAHRTTMKIKR